jgi:plastocyanin
MRRVATVLAVVVVMLGGLTALGWAADPQEIAVAIENNRFAPDEIRVKAGAPFVLVVTNKDKTPEEFESKVLRIEKVIPGGKTMKIRVPSLKAGTYPFVGEFHEATAKGRIVAE